MPGQSATVDERTCLVLSPSLEGYLGRQGGMFYRGVSAESVGSQRLCMHVLHIPPYSQGTAHIHVDHESAIYVISGSHELRYGPGVSESQDVHAGDMIYVPANVPHTFVTLSEPVTVVVARTDPREQESVHLLTETDH
jgi:uncharacterized RmlC-like cupin family protein